MLVMAPYAWFAPYKSVCTDETNALSVGSFERTVEYKEYKKQWEQRCMDIFYKYFPKVSRSVDEFTNVCINLCTENVRLV